MWEATKSRISHGCKYRIVAGDSMLSFRQFFDLLRASRDFADWYSCTLAAFDAAAFYWELPPLANSTIDDLLEFVVIDAPALANLAPDPTPFASHFDSRPRENVIVFPNLGRDAVLVVPCPRGPVDAYPHLAAFLRQAGESQVHELWRTTAETVFGHLGVTPTWLSTAGGGVAWLHLRLDSRPKYYQHQAYARMMGKPQMSP